MRETENITVTGNDGDVVENHPAFAVAVVTRSQGNGRPLFQSDIKHQHTVKLQIKTAVRRRELNTDWVDPQKVIAEVEMSEAQFGALVSSVGLGTGVPVTLRASESNYMVPDLPYTPRIATALDEVKEAVAKTLADVDAAVQVLAEAIAEKKGAVAIREAVATVKNRIENAPKNAAFAVTAVTEAAEQAVTQAGAEIEARTLAAQRATGIQSPISHPFAIETGEEA
ncbi:hypothetical protein [Microbacterium sp. 77mftsu3.1]|uniref:hypothetical protein n=1 Tax=Microbacterium sp. 77mftsu3.1 TaxID=1761802 RepID=UPI0003719289|nr:hypothetical protein [Microbacterium sp. 77mftsu3.1]SDH38420.1 hypothetical protein SAMN04488590_3195 [Microbacterium sp. 77mftsu3.1]